MLIDRSNVTDRQAAVDHLADSPSFRKAPVLRDLLLYLWQKRESSISEYTIGFEVLGRKPDFDPKIDSAVRVHISRLRTRLKEHYDANPTELRVFIPQGEYRLDFQQTAPLPTRREFPWKTAAIVSAAAAAVFAVDDIRQRLQPRYTAPVLDSFWRAFLDESRPQTLVVPAPLFFRPGTQPFLARDFRVNQPADLEQSEHLKGLAERYGPLDASYLFNISSDLIAVSTLTRYLEERRVPTTVIDSPNASLDVAASRDTILLVGPGTSAQFPALMKRLSFAFQLSTAGINRGLVDRLNPNATYPVTSHSTSRSTGHGLVALLPGKAPGTHVLLLASSFNPALASVLTLPAELEQLSRFLATQNTGKYFEVILRYERNDDRILDVTPLVARRIQP